MITGPVGKEAKMAARIEKLLAENERLRDRWKKLRQCIDAHIEAIYSHNGMLDDQGVALEVAYYQVIEDMDKLEQEGD